MTIAEFLRLMLETVVNGFHTFLGGLAPIVQWLVFLCAGFPMILLGLAGWKFLIKPAWDKALAQMAFGKDWFWMLLRIIFVMCIFLVLFFAAIWLAPRLGNAALVVASDGLNFTPAAPPLSGTSQPLINLDIPTFAPTTIPGSGQPLLPTPTAGASSNGNTYKVTDSSGATTRDPGANNVCDDNDAQLGSLPFGTVVTITGTWPSSNIPGLRGLTSTGVCVHLSALTKQ